MSDRLPLKYMFLRAARRLSRQGHLPLAFAPIATLAAYYLFGEIGLLVTALLTTVGLLSLAVISAARPSPRERDLVTGLCLKGELLERTGETVAFCKRTGRTTASFELEIDDFSTLLDRYGPTDCDRILEQTADRLMVCLRADDVVARVGDGRIAVTLHPVKRMDLELSLQIAARLQAALEEPISLRDNTAYITVSIGLCMLSRARCPDASALLEAAGTALIEARRTGPASIRAFSSEMKRVEVARKALIEEARGAFERGEICAWFQPQICTDTGQVSGMEALARWLHPQCGMISPAEFLPALDQAGLMDQLNETILQRALETLNSYDRDGLHIPLVGVNFAAEELRNPKLVDRVAWQLDRFEVAAERLAIEVLEHVVSGAPDDIVVRNLMGLANLGCQIDLDDFGTGHASITSLKRFPIDRLKIDRSFVTKCDTDPEQQQMLTAILTMAERLDLDTLAEGLETVGEHALLSQLGVGHVQGFGIARPMPSDIFADWVAEHQSKLAAPPAIRGNGS